MKKFTSMVKPKGNASCVFGELGAKENSLDPDLLDLKKKIAPSDHQILKDAYQRAVTSFEKERDIILEKGSQVIPQVNFADIVDAQLPHNLVSEIRKRGCVVIRNVYQQEEANKYNNDTNAYIKKNRNKVTGYPEDRPQIWEIYWSRSQVNARSHPNFTAAALAVQKLWHAADDTVIDLGKNLTYCDRLLVKNPGDSSFVLHEHLDNGSLERWQDPEYRKCYTNVLSGNWEDHDPYDATHRVDANTDYYQSNGGSSLFRSFLGFVAINHIESEGGFYRVCPLVKETTAYIMMKPLLEENLDKNDFGGAYPGLCHYITQKDYPLVHESMVSLPDLRPGDVVFTHCDQVHSLDYINKTSTDSSLFYIPTIPLCRVNSEYIERQREAFLKGRSPPDFPGNHCEQTVLERVKPSGLNELERLSMGISTFEAKKNATAGERKALEVHDKILGFNL